jgi:Bacterial aa3 type cytochrome c oxidase subunit IV
MAGKQDMGAAEHSYSGFLKLLKWGTALSVAAAFIVVLIIAS